VSDKSVDNVALLAALRTFYQEGNDVIHAISSAVLVVMGNEKSSITGIAAAFNDTYKMVITEAPLRTAIKRLSKEGYISYKSFGHIIVTDKGRTQASKLSESVKNVGREFKQLADNLESYCKNKGIEFASSSALEQELLGFIDENIGITSALVSDAQGNKAVANSVIADYIIHVEQSNATLFAMLQNLFFGRLYLSMLQTRTEYIKQAKFGPLNIYIDTTILFSALNLTSEAANKQAHELMKIIQSCPSIKLCVLDITISEARRVLNAYSKEKYTYLEHITVESTYYKLNTINIDKYRLRLLVEDIESKISSLGINIVKTYATYDKSDSLYNRFYNEISTWSGMLDRPKSDKALEHDAAALQFIQNERGSVHTQLLEKSKAIFLTPDFSIREFALDDAKNKQHAPLSYTPIELVSHFWFRDVGDKSIATSVVRQSVMAYARERAISHNLWEKFIEELKAAEKQNKLSDEDIGFILASDETERMLAQDKIRAIKQIINPKHIHHLRYQQKVLSHNNDSNRAKLERSSTRIKKFARKFSIIVTTTVGAVISLSLVGALIYAVFTIGLDESANAIAIFALVLVLCIAGIFGIRLDAASFIINMRTKVSNIIETKVVNILERAIFEQNLSEEKVES